MEETLRGHLFRLADLLQAQSGITPATIAKRALNDNTFFGRLDRQGLTFNVRTYDRLVLWISEQWPANAAWPADIPRPSSASSTTEAAA